MFMHHVVANNYIFSIIIHYTYIANCKAQTPRNSVCGTGRYQCFEARRSRACVVSTSN